MGKLFNYRRAIVIAVVAAGFALGGGGLAVAGGAGKGPGHGSDRRPQESSDETDKTNKDNWRDGLGELAGSSLADPSKADYSK